jgi:protein arginine kinase
MRQILDAAKASPLDLDVHRSLTVAERDYLVGCRLVSPEFRWTEPGRAVLLDRRNALSIMINEEDHLRVQSLSAGLSLESAEQAAMQAVTALSYNLEFAVSPKFGYLSASYINVGHGRRLSAMFHLIGLAQSRRLHSVISALSSRKIVVRGLFGEASRAVGAFAQISTTAQNNAEFAGACEYLLREERLARIAVGRARLQEKANQAREFVLGSPILSLADSLRALAWLRWAAASEIQGFHIKPREVDMALAVLESRNSASPQQQARQRAQFLRQVIEA